MNQEEAQKLVEINVISKLPNCAVIEKSTTEYEKCFVFYYQSKAFIKSNDFKDMLIGQGPVIVDKGSGKIFETGSAYSTEHYVKAFEACGDPYGEPTNTLTIFDWQQGANAVEAIKLLKHVSGSGLSKAKQLIDSVLAGENIVFQLIDIEQVQSTVEKLTKLGFSTKQLWSNQC